MGRTWVGSSGLDQSAIGMVARQAPGPVEHGQGPRGIFMDPHRDRHVMKPVRVLRDLQGRALRPHRIVLGHGPFVCTHRISARGVPTHGMKAVPVSVARTITRALCWGLNGFGQIPVGGRDGGDPGQGQLLGQAVLQGAEGALGTAARLGRVGRDVADAELRQGAGDLRQPDLVDPPAGLLRVEIVRAPVGVEGIRAPVVPIASRIPRKLLSVPSSSTKKAE